MSGSVEGDLTLEQMNQFIFSATCVHYRSDDKDMQCM